MHAFVHTDKCDGCCKGDEVTACMCVYPNNHQRALSVGLSIAHDCDSGGLYVR